MIGGLGPVVRYELVTTARRGRFYIARVAYGLLLLAVLSTQYRDFEATHPAGDTPEQLQRFAEAAFIEFAGAQGAALLCLIPALVAGVIADEYQRKTLHYLLASRLSSAEIVLGKLGARLVHVGTFVAFGIPVVCLLALYGGLNPENVIYVYLGTFTVVLFTSGFSILISIMAKRPRDAVLMTYGLGACWLLGPQWIQGLQAPLGGILSFLGPVSRWALVIDPVTVWRHATSYRYAPVLGGLRIAGLTGPFLESFYWMAGLQAGLGLLFIGLAVVGLRPLRGNSWPGGQPHVGWWARLVTGAQSIIDATGATALTKNPILIAPIPRRACGDSPMLWKELFTSSGGGPRWVRSRPIALFFGVFLGCYLFDVAYPSLLDAVSGRRSPLFERELNEWLRGSSAALAVLAMLGVAASSAMSLTGEREQDTWTSLATTLLTPAEVIRAKQWGAIGTARRIGLALSAMWVAGLLFGAIHPLGVLLTALYVVNVAWLIAAIGVMASAFAKNSARALAMAFIVLLIYTSVSQWPANVWRLLFPYPSMPGTRSQSPLGIDHLSPAVSMIGAIVLMAIQTVAGVLLTLGSRRRLRATWGR